MFAAKSICSPVEFWNPALSYRYFSFSSFQTADSSGSCGTCVLPFGFDGLWICRSEHSVPLCLFCFPFFAVCLVCCGFKSAIGQFTKAPIFVLNLEVFAEFKGRHVSHFCRPKWILLLFGGHFTHTKSPKCDITLWLANSKSYLFCLSIRSSGCLKRWRSILLA